MEKYFQEGDYTKIPPDDIERLKYYGIFYRKATPGYFMIRIRVPGGVLNYRQALKLAELAKKYAKNLIEITSRQQIQIRWVELKNIKTILEELNKFRYYMNHRQRGETFFHFVHRVGTKK